MTLTSIGHVVMPLEMKGTSVNQYILDADGEYVSAVFRIPKTGTLKKVCVCVGSISSPDTILVRLETVSGTHPSGTLYATGASGSIESPTQGTMYWVALNGSTGVSVTAGDLVALKMSLDYVDGYVRIEMNNTALSTGASFPYLANYLGGSSTVATISPMLSLQYGEIISIYGMAACQHATESFGDESEPALVGNMIKFPFGCRVTGVALVADIDYAANIILYDSSTADADFSTPLATLTIDPTARGYSSAYTHRYMFTSPITLTKDLWYRIVLAPTTADVVGLGVSTFLDDGSLHGIDAVPMGQNCVYTSANASPGEEADWAQDDTKRAMIALVVDQIDIPAGGGACASIAVI